MKITRELETRLSQSKRASSDRSAGSAKERPSAPANDAPEGCHLSPVRIKGT